MPDDGRPPPRNPARDYLDLFKSPGDPSGRHPFLPRITLRGVLAALLCLIPIRPFLYIFSNSMEDFVLELSVNLAAWFVILGAYKVTSRSQVWKKWWVIASGTVAFLTFYAMFGVLYGPNSARNVYGVLVNAGINMYISRFAFEILAVSSIWLAFIFRRRGTRCLFVLAILSALTAFLPMTRLVAFFVYL